LPKQSLSSRNNGHCVLLETQWPLGHFTWPAGQTQDISVAKQELSMGHIALAEHGDPQSL